MRNIKFYLILILLLNAILSKAQNTGTENMPAIIPPSPELASLAKIGSLSASMFTGAASANIPLYEINEGSIKLPIALSYNTNGTRVNEIPSRVGLGWNLIAGGNISKVIHDQDDDDPLTVRVPTPTNANLITPGFKYDYVINAILDYQDTESDEYSFSVNGMSGKFFFDETGTARMVEHSELKIERISGGFLLTTGDGIKYYFGDGVVEQTQDYKFNAINSANHIKTTGWFLNKVVSPEGDVVYFHYSPITIYSYFGKSQTVILKKLNFVYTPPPSTTGCDFCSEGSGVGSSTTENYATYHTYYLSSIATTGKLTVAFNYEARPEPEASGDNRLKHLYVSSNVAVIKAYTFSYEDHFKTNDANQRFYLKQLYTHSNDFTDKLIHEFEYNDPSLLPSQRSISQDNYGFATSSSDNFNLNFFPVIPVASEWDMANQGIDRSHPNFTLTRAGSLKKISYPTGGSEEFEYEPNSSANSSSGNSTTYTHTYMNTKGLAQSDPKTITKNIHIGSYPGITPVINIYFRTVRNTLWPQSGDGAYWTADDGKIISTLKIEKVSNGDVVYLENHTELYLTEINVNLQSNTDYLVTLIVKGSSYRANVSLKYNPVTIEGTPHFTFNSGTYGMRVKKINAFDPVTAKTTSKYYTYTAFENLVSHYNELAFSNASEYLASSSGQANPYNYDLYHAGGVCHHLVVSGAPTGELIEECSNLLQVSSSSISGTCLLSGSPVAYTNVIESDDPEFVHGGIEHTYTLTIDPGTLTPVVGYSMPGGPNPIRPDYNGTETKTIYFKNTGDHFVVLKQEENGYAEVPGFVFRVENYIVRKRWSAPTEPLWTELEKLRGYDMGGYSLLSGWRQLVSKTITTYDEDGSNPMIQSIGYTYANAEHCQPTMISTKNSKNEPVIQYLKYPSDFQDAPYPAMVSAHVITAVIEQSEITNGNNISKTINQYADWTGVSNTVFYKPTAKLYGKGTLQPETKITYKVYDLTGNPLYITSENGTRVNYLWDYFNTLPIAEVKNANLSEIAYTSFEASGYGNWTFDAANITSGGITGKKSFTGTLTKSDLNEQQTYVLTLWAREGQAHVNGQAGALVTIKADWHLLKWVLNGVDHATVEGTYIDEVRLIPKGATITTYTYDQFIGITNVCDDNNHIIYYEYDKFNRLWLVRDIDKNIIKQYEYKYGQPIGPGENTSPNWIATGNTRCFMDVNHNYNGTQQSEFIDMNNASPTYLSSSWSSPVAAVPPLVCDPLPACSGPGYMLIGNNCVPGDKVLLDSYFIGYEDGTGYELWECIFQYVWQAVPPGSPFTEVHHAQCGLE